ncbi:MAG: hypothetical protein RO009_16065 [Pseudorhodoplanes sp.]|jgi:hypothetical protein|nr:hypothetical protein [Pseudorhodoplanes sp.]
MCLACEEAELFYRFELLRQIADGKMPDGVTEADLRAMDLPLPGEVEVVEDADGKKTLRRIEKKSGTKSFACDSPNS